MLAHTCRLSPSGLDHRTFRTCQMAPTKLRAIKCLPLATSPLCASWCTSHLETNREHQKFEVNTGLKQRGITCYFLEMEELCNKSCFLQNDKVEVGDASQNSNYTVKLSFHCTHGYASCSLSTLRMKEYWCLHPSEVPRSKPAVHARWLRAKISWPPATLVEVRMSPLP